MKKRIAGVLLAVCTLMSVLHFTSCTPETDNNYTKEASFTFQTELGKKNAGFPIGSGRTYYVSAKGNDNNDGLTKNTPIKSIKKVNQLALQPGDTIAFKGGDTFTGATLSITTSGTETNPITICAYDAETTRPKILAQKMTGISFTNVSNLVIRDLEIIVNGQERVSQATPPYTIGIVGTYNTTAGYDNIYIVNNLVYGSATTSSCGIRITSNLAWADRAQNVLENVHIKNNEVHSLGIAGVFVDGWLTDINQMNSDPDIYGNVYINENTVYNVAQIPIYEECCHDSEMNRNLVYDSAMGVNGNAWTSIGQAGIMALGCEDTDIMYNVVYNIDNANLHFDGMGIDIDWNTKRVNVQYNHVYDCAGSGVGTMANVNCYIRNNRLESNDCKGNQHGQIHLTDFTKRYVVVEDNMHVVSNLLVQDNLIINDIKNESHFSATENGGDSSLWEGNIFQNNHLVSRTSSNDMWINISEALAWYKFAGNKYYKADTSKFMVFETTPAEKINNGALPYSSGGWSDWQKRDVGATYEKLEEKSLSGIKNVTANYSDGKVTLSWDKSMGDLWHYNVYLTDGTEKTSYLNMLGEAFEDRFEFVFDAKGEYYLIIEPESNQGVYANQTKIKITLN